MLGKKLKLQFEHVMSVLVKIVNYIWFNALKHRIFWGFLEDINAVYDDLLYNAEYKWLSIGKSLSVLLLV